MPTVTEQNTIVIEGVSWDTYLTMDELLDDAPVRMKWADDRLEIMSPISRHHELIKSNIGRMIEAFCRRRRLFYCITGSATMRKDRRRGGEPDDSYIFTRGQEATDLVIEAALSSGGIDKLDFFRPLEVPEVWVWQDGALHVFAFHGDDYERATASRFLPGLDLALVERLADHPYTSDALDEFERALEGQE
ncbi:MAG TPA: Uma2 family endonuclease [Chthoniobacteraceae bacterium]|jgi:Uma2 family endonuclease|nr:Uma2 family endonuclease [Chthoniobacteraceae bacterium]